MASRRKGRILAFQALYFWETNRDEISIEELVSFAWLEEEKINKLDESMAAFSRTMIAGTIENIDKIDSIIKNHLENWDISRLNKVDLAVIRISVYSLMFQSDIPSTIVIDEAIGICREFGADDSFKFVNGVLDSIKTTVLQKCSVEREQKESCA